MSPHFVIFSNIFYIFKLLCVVQKSLEYLLLVYSLARDYDASMQMKADVWEDNRWGKGKKKKRCGGLTDDREVDGVGVGGLGVGVAGVDALVPVLHSLDVQVPLVAKRTLHVDPLIVDDSRLLQGQDRRPLVGPHHLSNAPG